MNDSERLGAYTARMHKLVLQYVSANAQHKTKKFILSTMSSQQIAKHLIEESVEIALELKGVYSHTKFIDELADLTAVLLHLIIKLEVNPEFLFRAMKRKLNLRFEIERPASKIKKKKLSRTRSEIRRLKKELAHMTQKANEYLP